MATIKRLARFLPTPPPQNLSIEAQEWLREEFDRLTLASNGALDVADALNALPRMFLLGDADDFNLDTIDSTIVNYDDGGALGEVPIEPDPLLGTITIPITGAYRVTGYIIGLQASIVQNNSILLGVGVNGVVTNIASIDVATGQTTVRSLAATLTRSFTVGDVITMSMVATADMGNFAVAQASLELTLVAVPTELQSGAFLTSMSLVPWIVP